MELKITQSRHHLSILNRKEIVLVQDPENVHKERGAHLQCVNNHYAKFEYKGMKNVTQTRHPLSISDGKNV